jgi:Domain of unknown function (DUF4158)
MASRLFSDDQLEALEGFPDIGKDELIRFFTLTPADVAFADPGRGRGPADRLGLGVQRCTLPWLGSYPMTCVLLRPWRRAGWRSGYGSMRRCWPGTANVRRPAPAICGWSPATCGPHFADGGVQRQG